MILKKEFYQTVVESFSFFLTSLQGAFQGLTNRSATPLVAGR